MIDSTEIDKQPILGNNKTWAIFFIVLFFLGKILLLNMFVGIIIENIMLIKDHQGIHISIFFLTKFLKSNFRKTGYFIR